MHRLPAGTTYSSHRSAELRRPRPEKGAAIAGFGPSPCACGPRALKDIGPNKWGGPVPPCRTQHPAASGGSSGECGAGGGETKGRGWVDRWRIGVDGSNRAPNSTSYLRRRAGKKDEWAPGGSIYRPHPLRPRLTIGATYRADRWELCLFFFRRGAGRPGPCTTCVRGVSLFSADGGTE